MPTPREIRRRIKSVKSTAQITKAMEMVAASKMRRAQSNVLATRPYAQSMQDLLADLAERIPAMDTPHPLLQQRPVSNVGLVVVSADRGLCGGLNTNVIRRATQFILDDAGAPVNVVTVGRKGRDFMVRNRRNVVAEFTALGDYPKIIDIAPIARILIDEYQSGAVDAVYLVFTQFVNTLTQKPELIKLLPIEAPAERRVRAVDYIYEPDAATLLSELLPRYVEMEVYQSILESIASFFSAQMVAMRNATDNAAEIVDALTLTYNKVRQANITREIVEVSAGAAALS